MRKLVKGVSLSVLLLAAAGSFAAITPPPDAGPDWRGPDGSTALQWAVYEGDAERARALIRAGADVGAANNYGANAMQLAAETADFAMLKLLLDADADADSPNPEGQTALMLVARTGNVEAAELLVKQGANVNARENWGEQTALMWAAARGHAAMVEFLVESGADINARSAHRDYPRHVTKEGRAKNVDTGGLTPLMYAIRENCLACVEVLIENGVDLDLPDPDGTSPLLLAIHNNRWDISKRLIEAGADVQQWDTFGQAPLLAIVSRHSSNRAEPGETLNEISGTEVMRMLLERGANVNMQVFLRPAKQRGGTMSRGTTPLIQAASSGDVEAIRMLLEHGADVNLPQADLQTAVSAIAGARGNPDRLVEGLNLLVAAGADVNVRAVPHHLQRNRGGTPLINATRAGNAKVIEALVAAGADINAKDVDGLTALDHAMARNQVGFLQMRQPPNTRIADLLRSLGATAELDAVPFWPNVGPPFYYPWSIFPLDPAAEAAALVPAPSITNKKHDMTHAFSRRTLLSTGAQALGAATLGSTFAPLLSAQTAPATITRTDLGYAWLLQGAGCNVVAIPGMAEDGCLLIDGGLAAHSDALIKAALEATKKPRVHTLINTHYHPEQTGSNEAIGAQGGIIIAHEQTKMCLQNSVLSATFEGRYGPLADAGIPAQTLRGDGTMKFAGQEIIYGYLPAAHTNGDIFLYFPILDTLVTGGTVSTDSWPLLDIKQGAWMGGLVEGYEKLARVVSADTVVIPAHGPVTNGAGIIRMRNMYSELHLTLAELLNVGMGWDDVVAMNPLKQYEEKYGDASRFLELAQRSIQMAYVPD